MSVSDEAVRVLNKLVKWSTVFCGWQLGTRSKEDPEAQAVRDHRELTILMRAEISALTALLTKKGVFTGDEFHAQLIEEAQYLDKSYEKFFPGFTSSDVGIVMDPEKARETTKGWKP